MDNKEFLKETTNYVLSIYNHFEFYQKITWEILIEFNRVCQKCGINYWLCYGTLLGAIRDHGQVPWDYDVDVVSFFDDRKKLIDALKTELSDDFYYSYIDNTDFYLGGYRLLRICKKGYSMLALHVDVFFLVGASGDEIKMQSYHRRMERIKHIYDIKCMPHYLMNEKMDKAQKYFISLFKCIYSLIPFSLLKRIELNLLKKYKSIDNVYIPFYGIVVPFNIFETEYMVIKGVKLPIPKGYDYLLKKLYKDYYKYPTIESRVDEFYSHTQMIDLIQSKN